MNILEYQNLSMRGSDWTNAFAKAVKDLVQKGGGTLFVPSGRYPTGPIRLESNIMLYLDHGAELLFHPDQNVYPQVCMTGVSKENKAYQPCIYAYGAENVCLGGKGTLNGQGNYWWKGLFEKTLRRSRPHLVCFDHCRHVVIEDVTLLDSPAWTVHPVACTDVTVRGITIHNLWDAPNTDGINPESCKDVKILNCTVDVGDDCITIKAGTEEAEEKISCERIIVSGCHLLHGHGGIVIGSETTGSIRNIVVSNCIFYQTDRGIRMKTRRGRGGTVEGIQVSNLIMDGVMCPFVFNMYYFCGDDGKTAYVRDKAPLPVTNQTPVLRDVFISNVSIRNCEACAGFFYGLPECPVDGVTLRDIRIHMKIDAKSGVPAMMDDCPSMTGAGFYMRNVSELHMERVTAANLSTELLDADYSVSYTLQ